MTPTSAKTFQSKNYSSWLFLLGALIAGGIHAIASSWVGPLDMSHWPEWLKHQDTIVSAFGPFGWSSLISLLALMLLALLVAKATFWKAFLAGWAFAVAWLCGSVWWLYVSMHYYGLMPSALAALAVFLLCASMALIYAVAMGLARKASPQGTVCTISFAAAWLLAEMVRGWLFTGFPWATSGYAYINSVFVAYVPWLGVYGVSGVAALVAACVAVIGQYMCICACARRQSKNKLQNQPQNQSLNLTHAPLRKVHVVLTAGILLATLVVCWPLQQDFTRSTGEIKVALLQGNVPQELKFDGTAAAQSLQWYLDEMQRAKEQGVQLVLMPETAIPYLPNRLPAQAWSQIDATFKKGEMAALIGIPLMDDQRNITNSIIGFAPEREVYQYDKYHLVPFGEFVPWGFQWFVDMMNIPLGELGRGSVDAPSFTWLGQRVAPNICYEDLFGEELARRFSNPQQEPTIMANASNIAWFGDTVAIPQHLQIARMRALEFQRPMIRATNTGATAIIDYQGEVAQMLEPYTQGTLIGMVEGRVGLTPYVWWVRQWGLLPLWGIGIITLGASLVLRRKKT